MEVCQKALIKTKCELDFAFFVQYVFTEYYGLTWVHNWHHDEIIKLIYAIERRDIPNAVINMPPRYGKAIDVATPMLTSSGWKDAGSVSVGDELIGSDGEWVNVLGVFSQGVTNAYRVTFTDGSYLVTCGEHIWTVAGRYSDNHKNMTTKQIMDDLCEADGRKKWRIPMIKPMAGEQKELPIDPYLLGCWLGDGSSYKAEICTADSPIADAFSELYTITERTYQNSGKATDYGIRDGFVTQLKSLNLIGNKHIPEQYLDASYEQRLALLRGLMDTDGTCNKQNGQISFTNNNEQINDGVRFLISSFGGTYADYRRGKACTISFRLPDNINPFLLERKARLVRPTTARNTPRRFVASVEWVKERETVCFTVDADDKLYAAGKDLILTHNTELLVILWVCWAMIRNPRAQFIHCSYSVELALKNSAMIREILKSECIQCHWPIKMRDSQDTKGLWLTEEGGGFKADSSAGAITGFGAGITSWEDGEPFDGAIILDDPLKPDDARSEAMRLQVNERLASTIHSRRNHSKVPIIIVMQALHSDDPSQHALRGGVMGDEFFHLKLPALLPDGGVLWEYKHTKQQLLRMQASDKLHFSSQYQQEPYMELGEVYDLNWCPRYTSLPEPPTRTMIVHSWDTAYKAGEHNDPSVCGIWHLTNTVYYRADETHGKWDYPELRKRALELAERDKPDAILVEDKASGQSLIQEMKKAGLPVIPIKPEGDKETRARTTAAMLEAQMVALPANSLWIADWEKEVVAFPKGIHDDRVDEMSQFLAWAKNRDTLSYEQMLDRVYGRSE